MEIESSKDSANQREFDVRMVSRNGEEVGQRLTGGEYTFGRSIHSDIIVPDLGSSASFKLLLDPTDGARTIKPLSDNVFLDGRALKPMVSTILLAGSEISSEGVKFKITSSGSEIKGAPFSRYVGLALLGLGALVPLVVAISLLQSPQIEPVMPAPKAEPALSISKTDIAQIMRRRLQSIGLKVPVTVSDSKNLVLVQGSVNSNEAGRVEDIANAIKSKSDVDINVDLKRSDRDGKSMIAAVGGGSEPFFVLADGTIYKTGSVMQDGSSVVAIEKRKIRLVRDNIKETINY
jgi:hypothetical protein